MANTPQVELVELTRVQSIDDLLEVCFGTAHKTLTVRIAEKTRGPVNR